MSTRWRWRGGGAGLVGYDSTTMYKNYDVACTKPLHRLVKRTPSAGSLTSHFLALVVSCRAPTQALGLASMTWPLVGRSGVASGLLGGLIASGHKPTADRARTREERARRVGGGGGGACLVSDALTPAASAASAMAASFVTASIVAFPTSTTTSPLSAGTSCIAPATLVSSAARFRSSSSFVMPAATARSTTSVDPPAPAIATPSDGAGWLA